MPLLYHYCSGEIFKSIVETKSLWLTNIACQKDKMDGQLAKKKIIKPLVDSLLATNKGNRFIEELKNNLDQPLTYITCFSKNLNPKRLWEKYGDKNKGFAIAFDDAELGSWIDRGYPAHLIEDVSYDSAKITDVVRKIIEKAMRDSEQYNSEKTVLRAYAVACDLEKIGFKYKAAVYQPEEESRIIICNEDLPFKFPISGPEQRTINGIVKEHLKLSFPKIRDFIKEVWIGCKNPMDEGRVKGFLEKNESSSVAYKMPEVSRDKV